MPTQTPSFKKYLERRQAAIGSKELEDKEEVATSVLFNEKTFYHAFRVNIKI